MTAEFKLSRLRYTWFGAWTTAIFYNKDAVVSFDGRTFVCLVPHTSSVFATDLAQSPTNYWQLVLDGKVWKGSWQPSTLYSVKDIVSFGGQLYLCSTSHTSGPTTIDVANWSVYLKFDSWKPTWLPNTVYGVGDVVKYGGIVYICNTNHTSASDIASGLEFDISKWSVLFQGIEYKGLWSPSSVRYKLNDVVKLNPDLYICTTPHTSSTTFASTSFSMYLPGMDMGGTWSNTIVYQVGDTVVYGGFTYVSTSANNLGNIPSTATQLWTLVVQGFELRDEWSSNQPYKVGDVVKRKGNLFEAFVDNNLTDIQGKNLYPQDPSGYSVSMNYNSTGSSGTTLKVGGTFLASLTVASYDLTAIGPGNPNFIGLSGGYASIPLGSPITGPGIAVGTTVTAIGTNTITLSNPVTITNPQITFTGYSSGTTLTVTGGGSAPILPNAAYLIYGVTGGTFSANTYITSQLTATNSASATTTATAGSGVSIITVANATSITAGQWIVASGIPVGTYVGPTYINGATSVPLVTLTGASATTSGSLSTTAISFYTAGQAGTYTISNSQTVASSGTPATIAGAYQITYGVSVLPGMIVQGTGFTLGQAVTSTNAAGTSLVLNYPSDGTLTNNQNLNFTSVNQIYWKLLVPGQSWNGFWTTLASYSTLSPVNFSSSGSGSTFNVTTIGTVYNVTLVGGGSNYSVNDTVKILGSALGGTDGTNDLIITVTSVGYGKNITAITSTGTAVGKKYIQGDLAIWQNGTYVCIQTHTALPSNRPDLDTSATYWTLESAHARKNAMNTLGDLETYNNGAYSAVAIGTQGNVLRNTNNIPNWAKLNQISKVYYVSSSTGSDSNTGLDWDKPWKTIAYACSVAKAGSLYQNTAYIINQNKIFATTEMYYWMLSQKTSNTAPFTSSSVFDQTKTIRDAGYVIDALVYDITRGGNSQTVAAAIAYFSYESSTTFVNATVAAEMPYFIASLNYLLSLITTYILPSSVLSPTNQTNNSVAPSSQVAQLFYPSITPEAGANTQLTSLMSIITSALTAQSKALIPAANSGISTTINVKSGVYPETLPISVPENVAIVGDELRGVVVQPSVVINTVCTATTSSNNYFTVYTTAGMYDSCPIQFASPLITANVSYVPLGGVIAGTPYYVIGASITPTTFSVSTTTSVAITGNISAGSGTISTLSSTVGLYTGGYITGLGIPSGTTILSINTVTATMSISNPATNTFNAVPLNCSGAPLVITTATGSVASNTVMQVYGGDAVKSMFYVRNGSGIRNCTLTGLLGTIGAQDAYQIQRPTGGVFVGLDPGTGINDTTAWIKRRSPYIQNVTAFGNGCTALKIDGNLHAGGNKSIVANDFTHIVSDGIGVWCTGPGALTECISVFSYYGYTGYFAEGGGRIRAANGNSSYGTYGAISEGYDPTEIPTTGYIYNKSTQVQAVVESSFGSVGKLIKLLYTNAGEAYSSTTTNLLNYSNLFTNGAWITDGNITTQQIATAPTGFTEAWAVYGITSNNAGDSYLYQNIAIPQAGGTYTNLSGNNLTGSGLSATFDINVTATSFVATVNNPGSGYVQNNLILIPGALLGGITGVNDCILVVSQVTGSAVNQVTTQVAPASPASGVVPAGSALPYTFSLYVNQGTAAQLDIRAIFSGATTATSGVTYTFSTGAVTPTSSGAGVNPTGYKAQIGTSQGWVRLWFSTYDPTGLMTQVQFRIYPRGYTGASGTYSLIYGAQVEVGNSTFATPNSPSFYYQTLNNRYTSYANFNITGSGTGVITVGDETRGGAVFQSRVIADSTGVVGGSGYFTASNQAQTGDTGSIQLAQSDINTASNYVTLRVFINSGTGAGQYGYISSFDATTKIATVLKESFTALNITTTNSPANTFSIAPGANTLALYAGQPVQFLPTYYSTVVSASSLYQVTATASSGGTINTLTVASTAAMYINMPVTFSGTLFTSVIAGFTYYVTAILNQFTIQIGTAPYQFGAAAWQLTNATGAMTASFTSNNSYLTGSTTNMVANFPIQFTGSTFGGVNTGTTYYINDVIDSNNFTISSNLLNVTVTRTVSGTNVLTVVSNSTLVPTNPIIFNSFSGDANITVGNKYYISSIPVGSSTTFKISANVIRVTITATAYVGSLITCTSTVGFVAGQPIRFTGSTAGNIQADVTYYILAVNDSVSFNISQSVNGSPLPLSNVTSCLFGAITCPAPIALAGVYLTVTPTATGVNTGTTITVSSSTGIASGMKVTGVNIGAGAAVDVSYTPGSTTVPLTVANTGTVNTTVTITLGAMVGTTTSSKTKISLGQGAMTATFSTPLFGGVAQGTTYYINTFSSNNFTVSSSLANVGVTSLTLSSATGSMNVGAVGWDHVVAGTPPVATLDSTSVYFVEPRLLYSDPLFSQSSAGTTTLLAPANSYSFSAYGNGVWLGFANAGSTVASSTDGQNWTQITLAVNPTAWGAVAFGAGYFVAITRGTGCIAVYSNSSGQSWKSVSMPSDSTWSALAYGNGTFAAIATGTNKVAYSTTFGSSWSTSTLPAALTWAGVAYGAGLFVAVSSGGSTITPTGASGSSGTVTLTFATQSTAPFIIGQTIVVSGMTPSGYNGTYKVTYCDTTTVRYANSTTAAGTIFGSIIGNSVVAYSSDAITWNVSSTPIQTTWASIDYGNNSFVVVSSAGSKSAYTQDGINWYQSNLSITADQVRYGQGTFVAIGNSSGNAWISDSGLEWYQQSISALGWGTMTFGVNSTGTGRWILLGGTNIGGYISAGIRTKARANIVSNTITSISEFEPGSGYTVDPTFTVIDPNFSVPVSVQLRRSNNALASPTFVNRGTGYNTTSTAVITTGNGYSNAFQTGLTIIMNNLTKAPSVGDNLVITGISQVYKVTSAVAVYGTSAPTLQANVSISPAMTTALSPIDGTTVSIRSLYSQCRLTNHDFLNIGYGDFVTSNYPGYPAAGYASIPNNQTIEVNYGRVFYSSTDQDGNFKVGNLFGVQQATGIVTLSASQFALSGLNSISLGGIAVGGSSTIITQFSTDGTFVANSDAILPTQKAIKTYLTSRLSQGGANTFTGQLIAGTIVVGGPNYITSSVPRGTSGSVVNMGSKVYVSGAQFAGVDGNMAALDFFMRGVVNRGAV
jgi:hypothetical protein